MRITVCPWRRCLKVVVRAASVGGRIFLTGTSAVLRDNIVDQSGRGSNALFVRGVLDALSGREDNALMRNKGAGRVPLAETGPALRTFLRSVYTIGLPVLAVVAALVLWALRNARRRRLAVRYTGEKEVRS